VWPVITSEIHGCNSQSVTGQKWGATIGADPTRALFSTSWPESHATSMPAPATLCICLNPCNTYLLCQQGWLAHRVPPATLSTHILRHSDGEATALWRPFHHDQGWAAAIAAKAPLAGCRAVALLPPLLRHCCCNGTAASRRGVAWHRSHPAAAAMSPTTLLRSVSTSACPPEFLRSARRPV